jgi:hypothetical protein
MILKLFFQRSVVEEEEGTMVTMDAVVADRVDADEARTILAQPIQQIMVFVTIVAPMFLTVAKIMQQI